MRWVRWEANEVDYGFDEKTPMRKMTPMSEKMQRKVGKATKMDLRVLLTSEELAGTVEDEGIGHELVLCLLAHPSCTSIRRGPTDQRARVSSTLRRMAA